MGSRASCAYVGHEYLRYDVVLLIDRVVYEIDSIGILCHAQFM